MRIRAEITKKGQPWGLRVGFPHEVTCESRKVIADSRKASWGVVGRGTDKTSQLCEHMTHSRLQVEHKVQEVQVPGMNAMIRCSKSILDSRY